MNNTEIEEINKKLDSFKLSIKSFEESISFLSGFLDGLMSEYRILVEKIDKLCNKKTDIHNGLI